MADEQQQAPQTTGEQPGQQTPAPTPAPEAPKEGAPPATGDELGDTGKKALEAEREARKALERENKALKSAQDKLAREQMGEQEKQVADAEARGRAAAVTDYSRRLVAAELRALAAEDGRDATQTELWDMTRFAGEDGEPNLKALAEAVAKLPKKTPEQPEPPAVPTFDGGVQPPARPKTAPGLGTLQHAYAERERASAKK